MVHALTVAGLCVGLESYQRSQARSAQISKDAFKGGAKNTAHVQTLFALSAETVNGTTSLEGHCDRGVAMIGKACPAWRQKCQAKFRSGLIADILYK
jgi:hypothetical protein